MTTTRDAFEVWFEKRRGAGMLGKSETGGYEWVATSEACESWQAATAQGKRQPLTNEAIEILWTKLMCGRGSGDIRDFVRDVEAAHGIKA